MRYTLAYGKNTMIPQALFSSRTAELYTYQPFSQKHSNFRWLHTGYQQLAPYLDESLLLSTRCPSASSPPEKDQLPKGYLHCNSYDLFKDRLKSFISVRNKLFGLPICGRKKKKKEPNLQLHFKLITTKKKKNKQKHWTCARFNKSQVSNFAN